MTPVPEPVAEAPSSADGTDPFAALAALHDLVDRSGTSPTGLPER